MLRFKRCQLILNNSLSCPGRQHGVDVPVFPKQPFNYALRCNSSLFSTLQQSGLLIKEPGSNSGNINPASFGRPFLHGYRIFQGKTTCSVSAPCLWYSRFSLPKLGLRIFCLVMKHFLCDRESSWAAPHEQIRLIGKAGSQGSSCCIPIAGMLFVLNCQSSWRSAPIQVLKVCFVVPPCRGCSAIPARHPQGPDSHILHCQELPGMASSSRAECNPVPAQEMTNWERTSKETDEKGKKWQPETRLLLFQGFSVPHSTRRVAHTNLCVRCKSPKSNGKSWQHLQHLFAEIYLMWVQCLILKSNLREKV